MKLAEALFLRADYQKRLDQLKQRLLRNARVQEGADPLDRVDPASGRRVDAVSDRRRSSVGDHP